MNVPARLVTVSLLIALLVPVSACTTDNTTDTISSTTPGLWYTQDGFLKEEYKPAAFVTSNFENLRQDIAAGEGDYLASLGTLLRVPAARRTEFYVLTQARYATLFPGEGTTPDAMLAALHREMHTHRF